ncbi:MAG: hypothetical protein ACR2KQ_10365 [Actinomycetota bacterium]
MSVLLVGLDDELALVTARRLLAQQDEVRAIVTEEKSATALRETGVHVARGKEVDDPDLIERACQNVRTLVLGSLPPEAIIYVLQGASLAGVGRIIYVAVPRDDGIDTVVSGSPEYVILRIPSGGLFRRETFDAALVAEAIDAADDLDGTIRLDLDLSTETAWAALSLDAPKR